MTSNRPYLIRALYEWLLDNNLTPHLLVDTSQDDVEVPEQFVEDDRIVLNINPSAVINLQMTNDLISFNARFGGRETDVMFPPHAVLGIYARENGRGMLFPEDDLNEDDHSPDDDPHDPNGPQGPEDPGGPSATPRGRPSLKVVK